MNNFGKQLSSGNSKGDALLGGFIGLAQAYNPKGNYYATSSWRGNGVANGGVEFFQNPRYTNYYDIANMLSASLGGNPFSGPSSPSTEKSYTLGNNVLSKLSGIKGRIGNWASNKWGNMVNRKYGNTGDFYNNINGLC